MTTESGARRRKTGAGKATRPMSNVERRMLADQRATRLARRRADVAARNALLCTMPLSACQTHTEHVAHWRARIRRLDAPVSAYARLAEFAKGIYLEELRWACAIARRGRPERIVYA